MGLERITVNPSVMGGVPCLRGLRIPVATVVNMVAGDMTAQEIVDELPPLEVDDIAAALRFAADAVRTLELGLARAEDEGLLVLAAAEGRVIVSGDTDLAHSSRCGTFAPHR